MSRKKIESTHAECEECGEVYDIDELPLLKLKDILETGFCEPCAIRLRREYMGDCEAHATQIGMR